MNNLADDLGAGLSEDNFVSGNGSSDVLRMITQSFIGPGDRVLIAAPTFNMYEILVRMFGGEPVIVRLQDFTVDLDAIIDALTDDFRLIFVCNPNNPTGTIVTHGQMADFLAQIPPGIITVCDEAYMEFADDRDFPRMTEFIAQGYDVLVTRTFSKLYGLASLRVGYGFGRVDLMNRVRRRKLKFNSGRLAYLGAVAALADEEHISASLEMVRNGRTFLYQQFDEMGINYLPTQSNFIFLTDLPMDANAICDLAKQQGVILGPTNPFGLPNNIRITIAREEENARVVRVLKEIIEAKTA